MTFEAAVHALCFDDDPLSTLAAITTDWEQNAEPARALLRRYAIGDDFSEATPAALYFLIPVLAQMAETDSFADLCLLGGNTDLLHSALGDDGIFLIYPAALVSTFAGNATPLMALIERTQGNDSARGDAILALAYLTACGRLPERSTYDYLASLPAQLRTVDDTVIWFSYAMAVAWLGFAGLTAPVEAAFGRGDIIPEQLTPAEFWADLRRTQQNGRDPDGEHWARLQPIGDAAEHLILVERTMSVAGEMVDEAGATLDPGPEPIRNPLRSVGRNDPCPCGSGKKFKKCCLAAT